MSLKSILETYGTLAECIVLNLGDGLKETVVKISGRKVARFTTNRKGQVIRYMDYKEAV